MNAIEAKEKGFTHHAIMYGMKGFYMPLEDDGMMFQTRWKITDYINECITYLDVLIGFSPYGFAVKLLDEL